MDTGIAAQCNAVQLQIDAEAHMSLKGSYQSLFIHFFSFLHLSHFCEALCASCPSLCVPKSVSYIVVVWQVAGKNTKTKVSKRENKAD